MGEKWGKPCERDRASFSPFGNLVRRLNSPVVSQRTFVFITKSASGGAFTMKWFKHYTDAHEGRSLMTLFDEMGHAGPNCYWILVELCAAKLEKKGVEDLTEVDCRFNFHLRKVRERFRLSSTKVQAWFNLASTLALLEFRILENEIEIYLPQLIEILEHDQKKSRAKSASTPREKRLEKNRVEKSRVEEISSSAVKRPTPVESVEVIPIVTEKNADRGANRETWAAYREAYLDRYRVEPVRNAKVNANVSQFVARLGAEDAPAVIRFYVAHNDSFYVRNMHAFGFALRDAESLRTQWVKGKAITQTDVRRFERNQEFNDLLTAVREGEV